MCSVVNGHARRGSFRNSLNYGFDTCSFTYQKGVFADADQPHPANC
jgi:hypothetical protein